MKPPFFSIIIPVYNVAPYLRECLDSVLAQTFTDWEAICVDDGSTDGSGAILDEYAAKDKRVSVVHQDNAGVSASRNAALDIASGVYVCFVDGDDIVLPDWLSSFRFLIIETKCDWARVDFSEWDSGPKYPNINRECAVQWHSSDRNEIVTRALQLVLKDGYSCLNAIRRTIVGRTRFDMSLGMHEDCIFLANVICACRSITVGDYAGYLYRKRNGSACVVANNGDGESYVSVLSALVDFVECNKEVLFADTIRDRVVKILGDALVSRFECVVRLSYAARSNALSTPKMERVRRMASKYNLIGLNGFKSLWMLGYWLYFRYGLTHIISLRWYLARIHSYVDRRLRGKK